VLYAHDVLRGLGGSYVSPTYVYTFEGGHLEISKITNQNEADLPDHHIFSEEEVTTH
jgi:hypothetical protein